MRSTLLWLSLGAVALVACAHEGPPAPTQDGKLALAQVQVRQIATACELYLQDKGKTPESLNQLVPDYLVLLANDPWGQKFTYPAEPGTCEVMAKAPEGQTISSKAQLPTAYTK